MGLVNSCFYPNWLSESTFAWHNGKQKPVKDFERRPIAAAAQSKDCLDIHTVHARIFAIICSFSP